MRIYAGSFSRFFLGDWDGYELDAVEAQDDGEEDATPDEVQRYFEAYRDGLAEAIACPLAWSEAQDAPHQVVTMDEREFGALMIIAARVGVADKRMSPITARKPWYEDPAVAAIQDAIEDHQPVHHLVKADSWLPADFDVVIESEVPERDLIIGSLPQLAVALREMRPILNSPNEATRRLPSQLVADARSAHVVLTGIAAWATNHRMPILIDP